MSEMISRKDIRQLGPYLYEIPQNFRADMRVPARIYADETILQASLKDRSLIQLVNTATLPGIVGYALSMPDIHQGYGFPIGGVVATREEDGVISPGGVGYDINCLAGDTPVLHEHGYVRSIGEMAEDWEQARLTCFRLEEGKEDEARPVFWFGRAPHAPVLRVQTASGESILATTDHPFWTPDGMVEAGRLRPGQQVALFPFHGVPYEPPARKAIVKEKAFRTFLATLGQGEGGQAATQIVQFLKGWGLLPLRYDSSKMPYLIKLMGYVFGNGEVSFSRDGRGVVVFFGEEDVLEGIREDVKALGLRPGRMTTSRQGVTRLQVASSALAALLAYLGVPLGERASQGDALPSWLEEAPLWHRRLFLAGLFAAGLTGPQPVGDGTRLAAPVLSVLRRADMVEKGLRFLQGVTRWLQAFDVHIEAIQTRRQASQDGFVPIQLVLSPEPENLIRLWDQIGYAYDAQRRFLAAVAVHYLKTQRAMLAAPQPSAALHQGGDAIPHGGGARSPVGQMLPTFSQFRQEVTAGLGTGGMVWDVIVALEEVAYEGLVYDLTMDHPDHNFVANGFVVSNCGVRLLASEMEEGEVRPYLDDLATLLYQHVPSGVGVGGFLKLKKKEINEVLEEGARWALKRGYATHDDLIHTEEGGRLEGARADKVSDRAKDRGRGQIGTLGAGNHFAEIDVVDEIFDEEAAWAFGLFPDQVVVQIHCGSRGLGHQVCTDYVHRFQGAIHRYGITLPDRQLVCAPIQSPEGQDYLAAMAAAANFAWANRQLLTHQAREAFMKALAGKVKGWDLRVVYDIAHNMAKMETHVVDGQKVQVCVHRKGATRAFGPGNPVLPPDYMDVGQPVLVPGSMGTASYVLAGTEGAMRQTFGSSCHGAGRQMSRKAAKRQVHGSELQAALESQGIAVRAGSLRGLAEEAPVAYKDVSRVVEIVHNAGIARKVARLRPIAVVKG